MTQNPILKVLSIFQKSGVKSLLIGGQASIIYGAAEFSRDTDFIILCDPENLNKVKKALTLLKAKSIYVPPLKKSFLDKGHACHFRCYEKSVKNLRIDILAKLKGCDSFEKLWERRYVVKISPKKSINVIGLEDLVKSKKTQRDKDWLMLNRLIENDIISIKNPSDKKIEWWMLECRNPDILIKLAKKHRNSAEKCKIKRPLLKAAIKGNIKKLQKELKNEEFIEREKDKKYWELLKKELEILRYKHFQNKSDN